MAATWIPMVAVALAGWMTAPAPAAEPGGAAAWLAGQQITTPVAAPARLRLLVNGEPVAGDPPVRLVEPGERLELRAELELPTGAAAPLNPIEDRGAFLQQSFREMAWQGEPDDRFADGPGDVVYWRAGAEGGRVSYVTVTAEAAQLDRGGAALANSAMAPAATLATARAGILLIAGVAYDRTGDGVIAGVPIGIYPNEHDSRAPDSVRRRVELYHPPRTLFRIDERSARARITPHKTLGDLTPAPFPNTAGPRLVALSDRLLRFLPALEARLAAEGVDPARLVVLRGYITPNERLRLVQRGEQLADFTRFLYGDSLAVVLVPDADRDSPRMADVDANGVVDAEDARWLATRIKATMDETGMFGGLGVSRAFPGEGPSRDTPHVQFDLRGFFAPFGE